MVLRKPILPIILAASVIRSFLASSEWMSGYRRRLWSEPGSLHEFQNNSTSPILSDASNLPLLDFRFENLKDVPAVCGAKKCVFRLKADERIGYLAANSRHPRIVQGMEESYQFNIDIIENKYKMKTVLLAPPHKVEVDDYFIQWAKSNVTTGYTGQKQLPAFNSKTLVVQPVEIVQENESLLFGCEPPRFLSGVNLLPQIFNVETTKGKDLASVAKTVSLEFAKLYLLIEEYPCLYDDFQIFLTQEGCLIHLDVDRCFDSNAEKNGKYVSKKCIPFLKSFEMIVLQRLDLLQTTYG